MNSERILPIETTGTHGLSGDAPPPIDLPREPVASPDVIDVPGRVAPAAPDLIDIAKPASATAPDRVHVERTGASAPDTVDVSRTGADHPNTIDAPARATPERVATIDLPSRTGAEPVARVEDVSRFVERSAPPDMIDTVAADRTGVPAVQDMRIERPARPPQMRLRHLDRPATQETHWWN